jgi:unsaturated rhamnogalacturonyl hydrolase
MSLLRSIVIGFLLSSALNAQNVGVRVDRSLLPWSQRIAESVMARNPDTLMYAQEPKSARWGYERGVVLEGIWQVYQKTREPKYLTYVQRHIDQFLGGSETIRTYDFLSFNIDNIPTGRQLLALFKQTGESKYRTAADTLRKQLAQQPRTSDGGFWHKKIYPYQMWLDGLYMGEPFYAEYARMFNEPSAFNDIVRQFVLMEKHARDQKTGLLYHAWDERRTQRWADTLTGQSRQFWGRAMGWYAWGLVDVLDYLPADHPGRDTLVAILKRLCTALLTYQDHDSGLWFQIVDRGRQPGNYLEASASSMFAYAFGKGALRGYLDKKYLEVAKHSFQGILDSLITIDVAGLINLHHTCQGAGLGGNPYRDGSYEYYISEPQRTNDFKALGPFILAALVVEQIADVQEKADKQ